MNGRERNRRTLVWSAVVLFFAATAWGAFATDSGWWPLTAFCAYPVVGGMILTSRPGNWVGRVLLAISLPWALAVGAADLTASLPAWVEPAGDVVLNVSTMLLAVLVLVFPTGTISTTAGRLIVAVTATAATLIGVLTLVVPTTLSTTGRPNPFAIASLAGLEDLVRGEILTYALAILLPAALVELAVRWRRATGPERLQFRWFAFGVIVTLVVIGVSLLIPQSDQVSIGSVLLSFALNAIPVCIGIAVTRHGLYEINRVVSRTVAYAIVTSLAIGVYATVVTSVTWLLPEAPSLGVAAATLAAAALFLPVLRWVQRRLDRRFDRERYSAQKVVDDFGARLRTVVDPATTAGDLRRAVDSALQPASVGVWTVTR
jgi:hypothetical protein